jgi:hypothetical protein
VTGKILWFVLFLIAYGLFGVISGRLLKNLTHTRRWFWASELMALTTSVFLFAILYTLARSDSLLLPGGLFLATQISVLIKAAAGMTTVGEAPGQLQAEARWTGISLMIRHEWVALVSGYINLLIAPAYPVAVGIVYFSDHVPSSAATLSVTRITLLLLFIGGSLSLLTTQIGLFSSENLSAGSRQKLFYPKLGDVASTGLVLAVLLSTFSTSAGGAHSAQGIHVRFSPLVVVILLVYFLGSAVVPFLVGSSRNQKWQTHLRARRPDALGDVIGTLSKPVSDSYDAELAVLISRFEQERATFVASDVGITYGLWLDQVKAYETVLGTPPPAPDPAPAADAAPDPAPAPSSPPRPEPPAFGSTVVGMLKVFDPEDFYTARAHDPRFEHLDWLDELIAELGETRQNLAGKRSGTTRVHAAKDWAVNYDNERDELKETAAVAKSSLSGVVLGTLVTSLLGVVFTGFGNVLWTHAATALHK